MTELPTTLSAAIIGCGRMGQRHASNLRALGVRCLALCDASADALRAAANEFNVGESYQFSDVDHLFSRLTFDLVIVATTATSHCQLVVRTAEHGTRFILCEKPMACSIAECDEMIAACRQHGTRLAINHQIRFMPAYTEAKKIISSEEFGGLSSMTVIGGNGGLAMIGSHLFEAFRWITGEQAETIQAWLSPERVPNPRGPQFEDAGGAIRACTKSGKRLYVDLSPDQGHGFKFLYSGRWGQVVVDPLSGQFAKSVRRSADRVQPTTRYSLPGEEATIRFEPGGLEGAKTLLCELIAGHDFPSGEDGRYVVQCLVAAHVSQENENRPIRLSEIAPFRSRRFPWA